MENIELSPCGSLLMYKNDYTPNFVYETITKNKLEGLRIFTEPMEIIPESLDFLNEYTFLESLSITSLKDYELSFIKVLTNLRHLSINIFEVKRKIENIIDLSNQINLESLSLEWRKNIVGLENCQKIICLCLCDFKKEVDLRKINMLKNLKVLMIKTASIKSVDGVSQLTSLESILLGNCRSLKSVKDLNGLKKLKKIEFNVCSKIEDYHFLTDLPNLECLEFIDCRDIKTIKFIKNFPKLRELALLGNTNVLDSDMRPAKDIEDLCYAPRKHYNIKIETPKYDELRKQNLKKLRM